MASSEGSTSGKHGKSSVNGVYCIAPGCTNSYYKKKSTIVHFHRLPLKDSKVLKQWIAAMKRANPPINENSRVCSEHFVESDYVAKFRFDEAGRLEEYKSSDLKPGSVPSLFDFSSYGLGVTDRPSKSVSDKTADRHTRANRRAATAAQAQVKQSIEAAVECHKLPHEDRQASIPLDAIEILSDTTRAVSVATGTEEDPTTQVCHCQSVQRVSVSCCTDDILAHKHISHDHTYAVYRNDHDDGEQTAKYAHDNTVADVNESNEEICETTYEVVDSLDSDEDMSDLEYSSPECTISSDESSSEASSEEDPLSEPSENLKLIVEQHQLDGLFHVCHHRGCGKCLTTDPVILRKGFGITVKTQCLDGHEFVWHSQSTINGIMSCNLLIPSGVFITGNTYGPFAELCDCLSIQRLSTRQSYNVQKLYVIPEIDEMWIKHNEDILAAVGDTPVTVSGDARCDSPGHCATFGTYTLLDAGSRLIVAQETVKVTEVKNSYWMEPEGLERCLSKVSDHGVTVSILATDRHPTIQKQMREKHSHIQHEMDLWHMVKSIKKILVKSKKADLLPWVRHICNHLWYCVSACKKDVLLLKETWTSILYHITNRHEWLSSEVFHKCEHDPYTPEEEKLRPWLTEDSKAFQILQKVVMDKRLLKNLEKVTEGIHTGELESVHSLYTKYVPKRKKFPHDDFRARVHLAALDHNHSVDREQAMTKAGELQFRLQYSKGAGSYVIKPVKVAKTYSFRQELMAGVEARCDTVDP